MSKQNSDRRARAALAQASMQKAERRRNIIFYSLIGAVVIGLLAAAAGPYIKNRIEEARLADSNISKLGVGLAAAKCSPETSKPANGNQNHINPNVPISYRDAPPAFGKHYPTWADFSRKFYNQDRPPLANLVHNLEHGYTILWYDQTVGAESKVLAEIKAISNKFDGNSVKNKFIAAPWLSTDGKPFPNGKHFALTHWRNDDDKQTGVWQYCSKLSGAAIQDYLKRNPYTNSPEPNGG